MEKWNFDELADKTIDCIRDKLYVTVAGGMTNLEIEFANSKLVINSDDTDKCPNLLVSIPFKFVYEPYWVEFGTLYKFRLLVTIKHNGNDHRILRVQMYMAPRVKILDHTYQMPYEFDDDCYKIIKLGIESVIDFVITLIKSKAEDEYERWLDSD